MLLQTDEGMMVDAFPHPECAGMIRQKSQSHCIPSHGFLLDAQGNRIRET